MGDTTRKNVPGFATLKYARAAISEFGMSCPQFRASTTDVYTFTNSRADANMAAMIKISFRIGLANVLAWNARICKCSEKKSDQIAISGPFLCFGPVRTSGPHGPEISG